MPGMYDPERVLQVACPACGAEAGERCKTKSGNVRKKYDFHTVRKGVVYLEFTAKRSGVSDWSKRANAIVYAVDEYIDAKQMLYMGLQSGKAAQGFEAVAEARNQLFEAIKEGLSYGR